MPNEVTIFRGRWFDMRIGVQQNVKYHFPVSEGYLNIYFAFID